MITKMTKYTFLLLSRDTEAFLREIQELGVLDIQRSRKPVDATSAQLFREAEAIRKIKRFMEDEENLSKASQKIVKNRHQQEEEEEA